MTRTRALLSLMLALSGACATSSTRERAEPRLRVCLTVVEPEPGYGDRDEDGVNDYDDACPDDPEDVDQFEDGDGCPDRDNEGDRALDAAAPPEPDPNDLDGDAIPNEQDQCPESPEDLDGFDDENGCPDPDNDRDGVLDAAPPYEEGRWTNHDQRDGVDCRNEPEDLDGYQDDDGCPEPGRGRRTSARVRILERLERSGALPEDIVARLRRRAGA